MARSGNGTECAPLPCEFGHVRASDGLSCCWLGQSFVGGACTGAPSCPPDFSVDGETCIDHRPEIAARAEEERRRQERIASERDLNHTWEGEIASVIASSLTVRDKRSTNSDRAGGYSLGGALEFRFLAPLAWWSDQTPSVGVHFGLGTAFWYALGDEAVFNFSGSADVGLALGPVRLMGSLMVDHFDVTTSWTSLLYGVGFGFGSMGRDRNGTSWGVDLRWFPAATSLSDNSPVQTSDFAARAFVGYGLYYCGVQGRYFDQHGPLLDGLGVGLFMGINFHGN